MPRKQDIKFNAGGPRIKKVRKAIKGKRIPLACVGNQAEGYRLGGSQRQVIVLFPTLYERKSEAMDAAIIEFGVKPRVFVVQSPTKN